VGGRTRNVLLALWELAYDAQQAGGRLDVLVASAGKKRTALAQAVDITDALQGHW